MIEKDFVINNFLKRIDELERRLGELEKTAWTGSGVDSLVVNEGVDVAGDVDVAGNIYYDGSLIRGLGGVDYTGCVFVPLAAPLTSTDWDGDARSTTAKTLIDLSAVFGAPGGIRAVLVYVSLKDSGSNGTDCYLILAPNDTAGQGLVVSPMTVNDRDGRYGLVVPCNADGDVYYQCVASGSGTLDVVLEVWGYWV